MEFRFFVKKRNLDIFFISLSREISSQAIQTSLSLEKYAPPPRGLSYFSRSTPLHPKKQEKNIGFLMEFQPDHGAELLVALKTARTPSAKLFGE